MDGGRKGGVYSFILYSFSHSSYLLNIMTGLGAGDWMEHRDGRCYKMGVVKVVTCQNTLEEHLGRERNICLGFYMLCNVHFRLVSK